MKAYHRPPERSIGFIMDGYFTTYMECAVEVTAPQTVFESRQSDKREMIAVCNRQDGAA